MPAGQTSVFFWVVYRKMTANMMHLGILIVKPCPYRTPLEGRLPFKKFLDAQEVVKVPSSRVFNLLQKSLKACPATKPQGSARLA